MAKQKEHFIQSFEVKKFYDIQNTGTIEIGENKQWIFITGENGFGKTTLLKALAVALSGRNIKKDGLTINLLPLKSKIEVKNNQNQIFRGNKPPFYKELICYGSSRLELAIEDKYSSNPIYSLFETNSYLLNIEQYLATWNDKRNVVNEYQQEFETKFTTTKSILLELLNIADIEIDKQDNTVTYVDKHPDGTPYKKGLTFKELAAGYRNIIAIVGDFIIRLFKANPNNHDATKIQGIVIIDEFDLHLHPKWQRRFTELLTQFFHYIQFIVSTHSPIPLLGSPENSVFLKVARQEHIVIEQLSYIEVRNLTPNTILTSPLFDFEDLIPESHLETERLRTETTYRQVKVNDETKAFLKEVAQKLRNGKKL
jgi:predicted ATP-binding protein involved in virulence